MTPEEAYYKVIKSEKRIPELEPFISKDAEYSYLYAINIIKGRWELGEAIISKDAYFSYYYAINIIKDRFILAEPTISKDAEYSYYYARYVIKGKLPDFMHNALLLSTDEYTKEYVKFIQ